MALWIDVEDLYFYKSLRARPSGIQRFAFEMFSALVALDEANVGFVRHDPIGPGYRSVSWEEVSALYFEFSHASLLANEVQGPAEPRDVGSDFAPSVGTLRKIFRYMPLAIRLPLGEAVRAQAATIRATGRTFQALARQAAQSARLSKREPEPAPEPEQDPLWDLKGTAPLQSIAQPGDVLCVFGAPWVRYDIESRVTWTKRELGLRFALMVYDLIPIMRPEFVTRETTERFSNCFSNLIAQADHLFAISDATAGDVQSFIARIQIPIRRDVVTVPIGTGFADGPKMNRALDESVGFPAELEGGNFVLFVSTIEARKNHDLAFRVWSRLVDEMPRENVPILVLAGTVGWMVSDLMSRMSNTDFLGGKILIVRSPTDETLAMLYRKCRFTIFPSLYEGWGLPVTESLSFGRTCIASSRTSVPEAGKDFCIYIDPDNVTGSYETIRRSIEDDALIESFEKKIRDGFKPTPWNATARTILTEINVNPRVED